MVIVMQFAADILSLENLESSDAMKSASLQVGLFIFLVKCKGFVLDWRVWNIFIFFLLVHVSEKIQSANRLHLRIIDLDVSVPRCLERPL